MIIKTSDINNFWKGKNILNYCLQPFSLLWLIASHIRKWQKSYTSSSFIICVGNINIGGAGKTPSSIFIGKSLKDRGYKVAFLTKGYGRKSGETLWVNATSGVSRVGDEPILLAKHLPTLVSANIVEGLKILEKEGFEVIIVDDGLQNPSFKKDFKIIVINGSYGFGNAFVIPSGPLRQTVDSAMATADHIILLEDDEYGVAKIVKNFNIDISFARYVPSVDMRLFNKKVLAFCGIGIPDKFKIILLKYGLNIFNFVIFKDHHLYTEEEIKGLLEEAEESNSLVVCTEKDHVKIPLEYQDKVLSFNINMQMDGDELLFSKIIKRFKNN